MVNQENINLKLEMEILKVEQEIQKKKKNKEDENKNWISWWRSFWAFLMLNLVSISAITGNYGGGWQFGSIICVLFLTICICLLISSSSKIKKINKQIEKLERKRKDLRNSIR